MKKVLAYVILVLVLVGSGCVGTLSENLTPANIDEDAVEYVVASGVATADDYDGYPNLAKLKRLQLDIKSAHELNGLELQQLAEKENLKFNLLAGTVATDVEIATIREDLLFDPMTGAVALGLSIFGIGAGGYLGLLRKRPKDMSPEEVTAAFAEVKGEVTQKDRAILQLVGQLQKVIDAKPEVERRKYLEELKAEQLPETRAAVKAAKAAL